MYGVNELEIFIMIDYVGRKNWKLRYLLVWNVKQMFYVVFRFEEYFRVEILIKQVQRC